MRHIFAAILTLFLLQQTVVSQSNPDDYLKAMSLMTMKKYDSSLHYFNEVISSKPNDYDAIFQRGLAYYYLNNYPAANKDFRTVDQRYKGRASLMLAKTEIKLNHPDIAVNHLRKHLDSRYKLPEQEILLDPDLAAIENTSAWKQLWKEKEWYQPIDKQLQEARYLMSIDENLEALNLLTTLEKQGSKRTLVHQYKAEIYLATGNNKAAEEELTKSIKFDFRNLDAVKLRAELYYKGGAYEDALNDCQNILRQEPSSFEHYILSARLNTALKNYDKALENIETYKRLFPGADEAYYEEAKIHFANKKYLNAISALNKALELEDGEAKYYYARGLAYAETGTHKYAARDFSMSLDLDPLSADTWFAKGLTDMELGDKNAACFDFRKALQYDNFEAREYIERICK